MENIRRYFKRTDKTYLLLCIFSSVMAVTALSSWAAKQGNGFAVDEITGQITGLGDYRRAAVQAGAALIGLVIAVLLSNIDYRSLVKVWPVHVALTWGMVLPTLVLRNVSIGPLTIGYNAGDTDNYSWYKLGGFTLQPTELAKISFILTFAMHLNNVRGRINEPKELGKSLHSIPYDLTASEVKTLLYQLLSGIAYLHRHWYFHRDLKSSNLLYRDGVLKICDFGMARRYSNPLTKYTQHVVTLLYRAPELLLNPQEDARFPPNRIVMYDNKVDMWGVG